MKTADQKKLEMIYESEIICEGFGTWFAQAKSNVSKVFSGDQTAAYKAAYDIFSKKVLKSIATLEKIQREASAEEPIKKGNPLYVDVVKILKWLKPFLLNEPGSYEYDDVMVKYQTDEPKAAGLPETKQPVQNDKPADTNSNSTEQLQKEIQDLNKQISDLSKTPVDAKTNKTKITNIKKQIALREDAIKRAKPKSINPSVAASGDSGGDSGTLSGGSTTVDR